jgi:hypothetical protein
MRQHPSTASYWRRGIIAVVLCFALLITGCQPKAPSRFDQAQQESTQKGAVAVAKTATQGSEFNKFFPPSAFGYERVYTQEKKGFAEAKLKKAGKEVAMLAISDTTSLPSAAQKYANATTQIGGYPSVSIGSTQTGILVGKYQVKVISRDPSFTEELRADWLQKFNLKELAKLK